VDSLIPDSLIPVSRLLCLAILLLALGLRLYQLNADSLWEDEIFTATQSPLPVGELLDWTAGDIHPPGYYLIVGRLAGWLGWAHWPPSALTDWLWRFLSVLAGTLAVAVTYRLGADLFGRPAGLGGALLLALSPVAVQYSQEARMHAWFLLGVALSTWALGRALARPGAWRWWLAYALATAFSLYTVYLGFVVLAAQGVLSWMVGWLDGWMVGWLEGWKIGRLEGWKAGRLEDWREYPTSQFLNLPIYQSTNLPIYQPSNLPTFHPSRSS
jgi:4-amino-4-deoxy-L-arabinose transferase-like glycosyltransferase